MLNQSHIFLFLSLTRLHIPAAEYSFCGALILFLPLTDSINPGLANYTEPVAALDVTATHEKAVGAGGAPVTAPVVGPTAAPQDTPSGTSRFAIHRIDPTARWCVRIVLV